MQESFIYVAQTWWEWLIAGYLFLGGLAGMLLPIGYYYWIKEKNKPLNFAGGLGAFLAIVVGIGLLILDLGRPHNAFALFTSPRLNLHSWMTIGTYIIVLFAIFSGLYTIPFLPGLGLLKKKSVRTYVTTVGAIATFLGVATAAYTGFLLAAARGVQFWNNPLLPVLFITSGLSSGLCLYCAIVTPVISGVSPKLLEGVSKIRLQIQRLDAYVIIAELFMLLAYIDTSLWSQPGAAESARKLLYGSFALPFWIGVIVLGLIVPLIILVGYTLRRSEESKKVIFMSALAAWLILIGTFILRYLILAAGVVPVPLT